MNHGPPPPPHSSSPKSSGLPPGNYDIFIIPPHSSGSGFLYLPSLQPHRNSFLAGAACALMGVAVYVAIVPKIKQTVAALVSSGGQGIILLTLVVGIIGWAFGRTQVESFTKGPGPGGGGGGSGDSGTHHRHTPPPNSGSYEFPPQSGPSPFGGAGPHPFTGTGPTPFAGADPGAGPRQSWQNTTPGAAAGWAKAREEMRKREEERRKKDEAEKKAKEAAEKERWERARAREKEAREKETREKAEREAREKIEREAREKVEKEAREKAEKEAREKAAREKLKREKEARDAATESAPSVSGSAVGGNANKDGTSANRYRKPTAQSHISEEEATSFRPYDKARARPTKNSSASSFYSEPSSYAPSQSTARTTPPPSHRGPYSTKDPDKIVIKGVYHLNDLFPKPVAQLVSGEGKVTDGLVLRITSEGLFIDDDVRGVPQREWDVKAWTMKLVESGDHPTLPLHVLRFSVRDADNKRLIFVVHQSEAWKVAVGLQKLRRGTQVRSSLGVIGWPRGEMDKVLGELGWA